MTINFKEIFPSVISPRDNLFLLKDDSLKALKKIPDNSVDLFVVDPPYFVSGSKGDLRIELKTGWKPVDEGWDTFKNMDEFFEFNLTWITEVQRIVKPKGSFWIFGTFHNIYQVGFIIQTVLSGYVISDVIWLKVNAMPEMSGNNLCRSVEQICWARKGKKDSHLFNYELSKKMECPGDFIKHPGKQMRNVWSIPIISQSETLQWHIIDGEVSWCLSKNCLRCKETGEREGHVSDRKDLRTHPTQKPMSVIDRILRLSLPYDEETGRYKGIVVDPFCGTATTLLACQLLFGDVQALGIDMTEEYIMVSEKRLQELAGVKGAPKNKQSLFA